MGRGKNKFTKDPVYNKRAEVMDDDGGTNKFGQRFRGQQQQGGVRQQGPNMGVPSFGARPLDIDEEAEKRQQQEQEQHQQADYMAAEAEREALVRERNEAQAHLAQEQARERKQQFNGERRRGARAPRGM